MAFAKSDIKLNAGDAAEVVIAQLTNISHNENATLDAIKGSGGVIPLAHVQSDSSPQSQITSTDSTLLALNGGRFLSLPFCADQAASVVPFQKRADCGIMDTTNVHGGFSAGGKVMMVPTSIAGQGSSPIEIQANLRYLAGPIADPNPFAHPLSPLSTQAFAAAVYHESVQLAKAFIGGVEVPELRSFTISPNMTVQSQANNGGVFHDVAWVTDMGTTVEFVTEDLDAAKAVLNSTAMAAGGVVIYLARKNTAGGTATDPFASTVHKSITGATGVHQTQTITMAQNANGTGTIRVSLNNPSGANNGDLLTVASGVAIP